jgi:predicted nucleic acid-binding protein
LPSRIDEALARHDPTAWLSQLSYRDRNRLPFDSSAVPPGLPVILDTTVYIDALKGKLPRQIAQLLADRAVLHSATACAELALSLGHLDPSHPDTWRHASPLLQTLQRMPPERVVAPSADAWIEAALIAGTLARTQGYPKEVRRRLLYDAILLLTAREAGAVLATRNVKDMDLLLQLRPEAKAVFYDII